MTAYLIAAKRSAVAPRGGAFADLSLDALGAPVLIDALRSAGLPADRVDEVIVSNAMGGGGNPARLISLAAGLPLHVAGLSIDRQCAGGLDALMLAKSMIDSGMAQIVVAGGVESYSRRPLRLRTFADGRAPEPYARPPFSPWAGRDPEMTQAADDLATQWEISRADQDAWAMRSHATASANPPNAEEITQIEGLSNDPFTRLLSPRLAARIPAIAGSITAANMAVAADAAAFCVIVSEKVHQTLGAKGIALLGGATKGCVPELPGIAPIAAVKSALHQTGLKPSDIAAAEIMEAFAVQGIACVQGTGLDAARVNLGGGALARGHPIGASGTINAVRLFHELQARGGTGLAAIAAAGGIATAVVLAA